MSEEICSNCGHGYSERCPRCMRTFGCGSVSIECGHADCSERVIPFTPGEQDFHEVLRGRKADVSGGDLVLKP